MKDARVGAARRGPTEKATSERSAKQRRDGENIYSGNSPVCLVL